MEDIEKARSLMYRQKIQRKQRTSEATNLNVGSDIIVVEVQGKKISVPSIQAFKNLQEENRQLKTSIQRLETTVKKLINSAKNIDRDLKIVENDLKNKADLFSE